MFGKEPDSLGGGSGEGNLNSILGPGCKVKGNIELRGTIRIDGDFDGEIKCPETLIIGKSGIVRANVSGQERRHRREAPRQHPRDEQDRASDGFPRRRGYPDGSSRDRRGRVLRGELQDGSAGRRPEASARRERNQKRTRKDDREVALLRDDREKGLGAEGPAALFLAPDFSTRSRVGVDKSHRLLVSG